jgi:hypothetical protein
MMTNTLEQAGLPDSGQLQSGSQLRALGQAELARLGEESLKDHLVDTAIVSHQLYAPVVGPKLEDYLENRNLVRHPVKLAYEVGSMAPHQFGQPEASEDGFRLCLHPILKGRQQDTALAVAYFIPLMNYGALINDDHCLIYGATLSGMTSSDYYREICRIADEVGASPRLRNEKDDRF